MHRFTVHFLVGCLATVGLAAMLQADAWNKKTELTVHEKVEVPGAVLSPGKYVVKLVNSESNRHIVQFTNEAENQVVSTVLAIPNQRMEPTGDSEFTFYESRVAGTPVLRAWFYPGDTFGQQFAYPKDKAIELARASGEDVPSLDGDDLSSAHVSTVSPNESEPATPPQESAVTPAPPLGRTHTQPAAPKPEPAPDTTTLAQAQPQEQPPARTPAAAAPAPQTTQQPEAGEQLPSTASPAPLLGLLGLLSLAGALGLNRVAKQRDSR